MATYKIIQDVEAEDKLIGPLTFRQFVYAGICAVSLFLMYFVSANGFAFMAAVFFPPAAVAGFFAFPWGRDQPTELWALAKIRFLFKPRRRIWDQSGAKELVTVTAPKVQATNYTDGLSRTEVRSRLQALATMIDSHGWAIKGDTVNVAVQPMFFANPTQQNTDRLVDAQAYMPSTPEPVQAADDMLDEENNPAAKRVSTMVDASSKARRERIINELKEPEKTRQPQAKPSSDWFMNQPAPGGGGTDSQVTFNTQVVTPGVAATTPQNEAMSAPDEQALVKELDAHKQESPMQSYFGHLRTIKPISEQRKETAEKAKGQTEPSQQKNDTKTSSPPEDTAQKAALQQLSKNDNYTIETLSRQANEVTIKLH